MATVKFSSQERLKEIQSKVYLKIKKKLTQQEILELAVDILDNNIDLIINRISKSTRKFTLKEIEKIKLNATNWGRETENLSMEIDDIVYGGKKH